jgi:hypothetical protein
LPRRFWRPTTAVSWLVPNLASAAAWRRSSDRPRDSRVAHAPTHRTSVDHGCELLSFLAVRRENAARPANRMRRTSRCASRSWLAQGMYGWATPWRHGPAPADVRTILPFLLTIRPPTVLFGLVCTRHPDRHAASTS